MDLSELCVICKETFDENTSPAACLGEKGSASINQASVAQNDSDTLCIPGQKVHQECRRKKKKEKKRMSTKILQSTTNM